MCLKNILQDSERTNREMQFGWIQVGIFTHIYPVSGHCEMMSGWRKEIVGQRSDLICLD